MGRRAAPWRLSALARSAVLHAIFAFLATALVTLFGALPASGLTARHATAADTAEAGTPAMPAAVATVVAGGSAPITASGGQPRADAASGAALTSSTGSGDADDRGLLLPGAEVPPAVRSVGPGVPEPGAVAPAPRASSGVISTVWGRAPPA